MSVTSPVSTSPYYAFDSVAEGFHQYHSIWNPVVGKELPCKCAVHNLCIRQLIHVCHLQNNKIKSTTKFLYMWYKAIWEFLGCDIRSCCNLLLHGCIIVIT